MRCNTRTVVACATAMSLSMVLAGRLQAQQRGHAAGGHDPQLPHMEHRFDDPERYAESFDDPARDEWQMPDRVIAALGLGPGQAVADIGAGTGYFSVRLARARTAPRVYAVDIEPSMVEYVRQRATREGLSNIVAVQATAKAPNLPQPVDVILIVDTYHHIPNRVAYFSALAHSLKPGGRVAIVDFRKGVRGGGPPDEFRFTPEEISGELQRAGFALREQHDFLPRQLFLIYQVR